MFSIENTIIIAIIISGIHLIISFSLKLAEKYKKSIRIYSVLINLAFLGLLIGFYIFSKTSSANLGIDFYLNALVSLYFLLFLPLELVLLGIFSKWIMKADIYSKFLKYTLIAGNAVLLASLLLLGYPIFILTFYGFAP
ncbi:MAG: hypothetical protein L0L39_05460 [Atopostipes suicloacalis]|nr:hypothetical protein [Atopostipes suicloacalis]